MKTQLTIISFIIFMATLMTAFVCHAVDVPLGWESSVGADGYMIEMSLDQGATWETPVDVGNVLTYTYLNVPNSGLVLFRAIAYKTDTPAATRYWSGAWYNGDWKPIDPPSGMGVE